ncbi:MAG: N-6 DNA methylase, partial [Candidatus Marinimicrobia bacterium]|nr:N-6 DNA methylase [Candidatus Neomarinimicrobiota bacterium]
MKLFDSKEDVAHTAQSVRMDKIAENDFNLSVSSYVEAKDTREVINITELNKEIEATVGKIDGLRRDIDVIVAEIEGVQELKRDKA